MKTKHLLPFFMLAVVPSIRAFASSSMVLNPLDAPAAVTKNLTAWTFFGWDLANDAAAQPQVRYWCNYEIGKSAVDIYGDPNVQARTYADLSQYDYLTIMATEGTPRLLLNRPTDTSQDYVNLPNNAEQAAKYILQSSDGVYVYDLSAIRADYGFVHLHAIKGNNFEPATLTEVKLATGTPYQPGVPSSDAEVALIYRYNKNSKTAEFLCADDELKGSFEIPASIVKDGVTYSVTSIGSGAFYGCSSLTSVTIPSSVTTIGSTAFQGCSGLTSVTIPSSVTSIGSSAFNGCSGLTSITIPSSVTSIGNAAFDGCSGLTSITIPNSVTSIDGSAFHGCSGLTSITIPSSVTSIGNAVFMGCSALTSITIPSSVTSIGSYAFSGCGGLTSIIIPDGVTSINYGTFWNCSGLTSLTIGSGVTSIGVSAFEACSSLTSVTIPSSVTSIDEYAFVGCSGLTSLTIGSGVTHIGSWAFAGCKALTSVTIPNSVTSIDEYAFRVCSNLTSITIPSSVENIGFDAFGLCSSLASIKVDEGNSVFDSRGGCNAIIETSSNTLIVGCQNTIIPNSVTTIGNSAFDGCETLTSVVIPNSVTNINDCAFNGCSGLTSINIPNSVTNICSGAFGNCSGLTDVYCEADDVPTTDESVFTEVSSCTLHVPAASLEAYKATVPWNEFGNIVPIVEIVPMEEETTVAFDNNITEETDLSATVIENIFVTLNTEGEDGYDTEEKCIVLASTVTDEQLASIADKEVGDNAVKENFNGLIIEVLAGTGTISIDAQTKGSRTLNVKVGTSAEQTFIQSERGVVEVPYTVEKDTYVYIYGAEKGNDARRRAFGVNAEKGVLIYGIKWTGDTTDIDAVATANDGTCQIYTIDGTSTNVLQQGVNIIRMSDGTIKKVFVK